MGDDVDLYDVIVLLNVVAHRHAIVRHQCDIIAQLCDINVTSYIYMTSFSSLMLIAVQSHYQSCHFSFQSTQT